jgi:hypothetical protein
LEVADIFRDHGAAWRSANAGHVSLDQLKVMSAVERCRTMALGGHVARCENCANTVIAYNSCRNRHSPKWQAAAAKEWLADREAELLPVPPEVLSAGAGSLAPLPPIIPGQAPRCSPDRTHRVLRRPIALRAAFSMIMIMTGVANTGGRIASLNRSARSSGWTKRLKEPLAPRGICLMACPQKAATIT